MPGSVDSPPTAAPPLARDPNALALERTLLAASRTLMAWMRTSVSLIGFGFTIFKFFQYLGGVEIPGVHGSLTEPRILATVLVSLGLLLLALGVAEYVRFLHRLGQRLRRGWPGLLTASLLWCVGALVLAVVLTRAAAG